MSTRGTSEPEIGVLVTGVGGPVGQAILKALRLSSLRCRVVVSDRDAMAVGLFWENRAYVLPSAESPEYVTQLGAVCEREAVDVVLLGSEGELSRLAPLSEEFEQAVHSRLIVSSEEVIRVALDKWETYLHLKKNGFPYPRTAPATSSEQVANLVEEVGFPVIVKPSTGSGSKNVFRADNKRELDFFRTYVPGAIVQEYLAPDTAEFTVAVFVSEAGEPLGSITMRRQLVAGVTYRAEVVQDQAIAELTTQVAASLRPLGPCNFQLRVTKDGPVIFEINPRFSSSTGMRARLGFNEVELALRHFVQNEQVSPPSGLRGIALRYWEEYYPEAAVAAQVAG